VGGVGGCGVLGGGGGVRLVGWVVCRYLGGEWCLGGGGFLVWLCLLIYGCFFSFVVFLFCFFFELGLFCFYVSYFKFYGGFVCSCESLSLWSFVLFLLCLFAGFLQMILFYMTLIFLFLCLCFVCFDCDCFFYVLLLFCSCC